MADPQMIARSEEKKTTTDLPLPSSALAVGAHPDDVEFGCGATLAKWASQGCAIYHLICTDGSKGSWDDSADIEELVRVRQQEQRQASKALGGSGDVVFLGFTDGELAAGREERLRVCQWIRRIKDEVVLGHDPWRRYRLHPDHRNAGFLVTDGIVAARDPHFFPELEESPHRPSALLLWEADEPDHVESVEGFTEDKLTALMCHRSQFRSTMSIEDPSSRGQIAAFRERLTNHMSRHGEPAGLPAGEGFKLLTEI